MLGGHLTVLLSINCMARSVPLQIVTTKDVVNLVERLRSLPHQLVTHLRKLPVLLYLLAGKINPTYLPHAIASQQTIPIDPQKLAHRRNAPSNRCASKIPVKLLRCACLRAEDTWDSNSTEKRQCLQPSRSYFEPN